MAISTNTNPYESTNQDVDFMAARQRRAALFNTRHCHSSPLHPPQADKWRGEESPSIFNGCLTCNTFSKRFYSTGRSFNASDFHSSSLHPPQADKWRDEESRESSTLVNTYIDFTHPFLCNLSIS